MGLDLVQPARLKFTRALRALFHLTRCLRTLRAKGSGQINALSKDALHIALTRAESPSRAPRAATRGGFAAARAACVSTWLGERYILCTVDATYTCERGVLSEFPAACTCAFYFHLTRCLRALRARLQSSLTFGDRAARAIRRALVGAEQRFIVLV